MQLLSDFITLKYSAHFEIFSESTLIFRLQLDTLHFPICHGQILENHIMNEQNIQACQIHLNSAWQIMSNNILGKVTTELQFLKFPGILYWILTFLRTSHFEVLYHVLIIEK